MQRAQANRNQYLRRPRKNNKLQVRINDDELETLTSISIEDDETISQVVRKAIKAYKLHRNETKT